MTDTAVTDTDLPATIALRINGTSYAIPADPTITLLDAIRERVALTGTKKGCDYGQCGACSVLVNGRRVLSCLSLAIMHRNDDVTTIEGLADDGRLNAVQNAFIKHDAFQCGFCTSGQIVSAVGLISEGRPHSDDEIREGMSGNICRCGAYPNIVEAVREAMETTDAHV